MVQYDPETIRRFADSLEADAVGSPYYWGIIGVLFGAVFGAIFAGADAAVIGGVLGGATGAPYGDHRAGRLRLQAQMVLCQLRIEQSLRSKGERHIERAGSPSGPSNAGEAAGGSEPAEAPGSSG